MLAATHVITMPPRPESSQRPTEMVRLWKRTRSLIHTSPVDTLVVEIAGRGLAEFWVAFGLSHLTKIRLWLTIHDSPELSGGAFFFTPLDRKGVRRLAAALSRTIGRRAERSLLKRCERVLTLSPVGADEIRSRFGEPLPLQVIAHVVGPPVIGPKQPRIFLPGYLSGRESILPVLDVLESSPSQWVVEIGATDEKTAGDIGHEVARRGLVGRVKLLGFQSEDDLLRTFSSTRIVVRWRAQGWAKRGAPQHGAVSGPLMRAIADGCAVVTNDRRGSVSCLDAAGAFQIGDGEAGADELRSTLRALIADSAMLEEAAENSKRHYVLEHTPAAVARQLEP
jgi:hypothetical protein